VRSAGIVTGSGTGTGVTEMMTRIVSTAVRGVMTGITKTLIGAETEIGIETGTGRVLTFSA